MTRTRATYGCCGAPATPDRLHGSHKCNLGRGGAAASSDTAGKDRASVRLSAIHPAPSRPAGRAAEDAMAVQLVHWFDIGALTERDEVGVHNIYVRQFAWALAQGRGFAFDFAWPAIKVALEVVGGAHAAGRAKVKADVERSGLAASLGWRVVTVTPEQVATGAALALIRGALNKVGW